MRPEAKNSKPGERLNSGALFPELQELVNQSAPLVYEFTLLMLGNSDSAEEQVLAIFREYGDRSRKLRKRGKSWGEQEARIELFLVAWRRLQRLESISPLSPFSSWSHEGRDTRGQKDQDENLILFLRANGFKEKGALETDGKSGKANSFRQRIIQIDPQYRAPLILRDILGLEDEEAIRVLGLRWGVYRHRLHRGRLELCEALRGKPYVFKTGLIN